MDKYYYRMDVKTTKFINVETKSKVE